MEKEISWRFCVAGNIVRTHTDESGVLRYGTKAFTGGTKVYINGKNIQDPDKVEVIGLNRFGRFVLDFIPVEYVENFRQQRVYKPKVLEIISALEALEGDIWWENSAKDREESLRFAEKMRERNENGTFEKIIENPLDL